MAGEVDGGVTGAETGKVVGGAPVHSVGDIEPCESVNMSYIFAFERLHDLQSVCLNDVAPENMRFMSVTRNTSHFEISPLNAFALWNMLFISVTLETSQLEISPLNDAAP